MAFTNRRSVRSSRGSSGRTSNRRTTLRISFEGGLNERGDQGIDPREAASGENFELGLNINYFRPRDAFDHYATAPITTSPIAGFAQLIKRDDTETTLVVNGVNVYQVSGSPPVFSSVGTVTSGSKLRDVYWALGDYLILTDITKTTVVKKWDGTTFSSLTTGLGTALYAKYGVVHKGRVWLFNVKTSTDTPHLMVASAFENPESYDTSARAPFVTSTATGNEAFYMLTPDLRPINGVTVFYNELIISTQRGKLYKLAGSDANDFQWVPFYQGSAAIGNETMVNIGNDVAFMKEGGAIDLLSATQQFGDVRADDVSRWIQTSVQGLTDGIAVYDQFRQKVYWFVQEGTVGKVLTLFKDRMVGDLSPWSVYTTGHASDFVTSAARYMRKPGTVDYYTFFGDSTGKIFFMPGTGEGDGDTNTPIRTTRRTRLLEADGVNNIALGVIQYRRLAEVEMTLNMQWGEDYGESVALVTLKGPSGVGGAFFGGSTYFGGDAFFNEGFRFEDKPSKRSFSHVGVGDSFTLELSADTVKTFQVDFVELGLGS